MSKLDDIRVRNEHENDAYDRKEAHRAFDDREYLLELVKYLTEVLSGAVPIKSGDFNGDCFSIKRAVLEAALDKVKS